MFTSGGGRYKKHWKLVYLHDVGAYCLETCYNVLNHTGLRNPEIFQHTCICARKELCYQERLFHSVLLRGGCFNSLEGIAISYAND